MNEIRVSTLKQRQRRRWWCKLLRHRGVETGIVVMADSGDQHWFCWGCNTRKELAAERNFKTGGNHPPASDQLTAYKQDRPLWDGEIGHYEQP